MQNIEVWRWRRMSKNYNRKRIWAKEKAYFHRYCTDKRERRKNKTFLLEN